MNKSDILVSLHLKVVSISKLSASCSDVHVITSIAGDSNADDSNSNAEDKAHLQRSTNLQRSNGVGARETVVSLAPLLLLPAYTSSYCLQHWHLQLSTLLLTSSAWSSISFVPAVLPKMAPESSVPKVNHQQRNVNLFALAGRHAPKLDALQHLPRGMHLIGVGRPSDGVAGKCMPARVCMCCPFDLLP